MNYQISTEEIEAIKMFIQQRRVIKVLELLKNLEELKDIDVKTSDAYQRVLNHRKICEKWKKLQDNPEEMCLECWGGGLVKFCEEVGK